MYIFAPIMRKAKDKTNRIRRFVRKSCFFFSEIFRVKFESEFWFSSSGALQLGVHMCIYTTGCVGLEINAVVVEISNVRCCLLAPYNVIQFLARPSKNSIT